MARTRDAHVCSACGASAPRWAGRCGSCGEWNTLAPTRAPCPAGTDRPVPIDQVDGADASSVPTGIGEWDRVLGGGLPSSGLLLLAGEPGIGKSTLALQVAASAARGADILYACAEESPAQVRRRAERLGALPSRLLLSAPRDMAELAAQVAQTSPALVIVDSVQSLADPGEAASGSASQVRACAAGLAPLARREGRTVLLVGHVTKEGAVAGPRTLEHLVDAVLLFEGECKGERGGPTRVLRALKNRFGSTEEIGLFRMEEDGLHTVDDPSALFRSRRGEGAPGSALTVAMEGRRPLLVEIQALTSPARLSHPERRASGIDPGRLPLLLAVLERHAGLPVTGLDCFVNVVGGLRLAERSCDLAVAVAIASAYLGVPHPSDAVVLGEVGLTGEVLPVPSLPRRLQEASRLGCPRGTVPSQDGAQARAGYTGVARLAAALRPLLPEIPTIPGADGAGRLRETG
ncbi:MAG: DNA repair protein RadA [Planctomycetes bacterium]|nr:DNA repair protein RadA [Planctomycetota bacterium]